MKIIGYYLSYGSTITRILLLKNMKFMYYVSKEDKFVEAYESFLHFVEYDTFMVFESLKISWIKIILVEY